MTCPSCKQPTTPERNYCGSCGASLVQYCRSCGFRNLESDRFCGGCGGKLADGGERTAPRSHRPSAGLPGPTRTGADVDELLEAAKKGSASEEGEAPVRVSQSDIDHLFGGGD